MKSIMTVVRSVKAKADQSVDFSPKDGATCPECGKKHLAVITSRRWEDGLKVRYHKCDNEKCLLANMGTSIKSVQIN